jgi:DnaJ-class molecular chaperone
LAHGHETFTQTSFVLEWGRSNICYTASVTFPKRDPYQVLGVPRDADDASIKRAYRERAMRDHPDRNPNDPAAAERFKLASEAYATLRDPESRRRYDTFVARGGSAQQRAPQPDFSTVDWRAIFREADVPIEWTRYGTAGGAAVGNVIFDMLFQGVTRAFAHAGLIPGSHREVPLRIDLSTARAGGSKRVHLPGPIACPACRQQHRPLAECTTCGGSGTLAAGMTVEVRIPRGVRQGQKLRLAGMGGPGRPAGDAFVVVDFTLPSGVRTVGNDLHIDLTLTPLEAQVGGTRWAAGSLLSIPAGTRAGSTLVFPGLGVGGGSLHAHIRIDIWRGLAAQASAALQQVIEAPKTAQTAAKPDGYAAGAQRRSA